LLGIHIPRRAAQIMATAAALATIGGGTLALAGPASAAPLPGPGPVRFAPEFFTLNVPPGTGNAYGPVRGHFTDNEISPTAGVWTFGFGPFTSKVLVRHTEVTTPEVNPLSCRGFKVEHGRWILTGLTGIDRHAFGFGRFTAYVSDQGARNSDGQCEAYRVISERVSVVGQGIATNPRHIFTHPYVAPV
jgi:hypothetical protein